MNEATNTTVKWGEKRQVKNKKYFPHCLLCYFTLFYITFYFIIFHLDLFNLISYISYYTFLLRLEFPKSVAQFLEPVQFKQ